ncbi:Intestinal mucin-like protein [Holothuria leucospilota]|uniref:Intestinal mucin-like protein n=1 Tax=Holothuria leucospilota TaxID=206669 RepID=A0A9Q1BD93_HOLLE|nr:Intestinal mucin-like protein [Holothuria leucospilota]
MQSRDYATRTHYYTRDKNRRDNITNNVTNNVTNNIANKIASNIACDDNNITSNIAFSLAIRVIQLIVEAMGHTIRLLSNLTATWRPQAVIDGKLVAPPYLHEDFSLYANGIFMVLVVPDIGLEVRFLPQGYNFFRVVVPLAVYYNNTDGLCGWCGMNRTNCQERGDCCEEYLYPPDPDACKNKTDPAPCVPTQEQLKWCDNLFLPVFEPCWEYVDPCDFFDTCTVDICVSNRSQSCWSLEAYAQECSYHGICLEWRNETFCDDPCPPGREFKECVCPEQIYLNSTCIEEEWEKGGKDKCELDPVEGCFCPPGTKEEEDGSCVPCYVQKTENVDTTLELEEKTKNITFLLVVFLKYFQLKKLREHLHLKW